MVGVLAHTLASLGKGLAADRKWRSYASGKYEVLASVRGHRRPRLSTDQDLVDLVEHRGGAVDYSVDSPQAASSSGGNGPRNTSVTRSRPRSVPGVRFGTEAAIGTSRTTGVSPRAMTTSTGDLLTARPTP